MNDNMKKRILPWKYDEQADPSIPARADTLIGGCVVIRTFNSRFSAIRVVGVAWIDINNGHEPFDTIDAAMDACEADYIERCSEFLRFAGPGECVVSIEPLRVIANIRSQSKKCSCEECTAIRQLITEMESQTAAIDAASKE